MLCMLNAGTPFWKLVLKQFDDLLVKILIAAAIVSFVLALINGETGLTAFLEPSVRYSSTCPCISFLIYNLNFKMYKVYLITNFLIGEDIHRGNDAGKILIIFSSCFFFAEVPSPHGWLFLCMMSYFVCLDVILFLSSLFLCPVREVEIGLLVYCIDTCMWLLNI